MQFKIIKIIIIITEVILDTDMILEGVLDSGIRENYKTMRFKGQVQVDILPYIYSA